MATIQYVINAVDNASRTFNEIADAADRMDAAISAAQAVSDRMTRSLAVQEAAVEAVTEKYDAMERAVTVVAAAMTAAGAGLVDTARNAGYLAATFGLVSEQSKALLATDAQLTAMNKSLAESFGNIRSQAAMAAISEGALAAMNERLSKSFDMNAGLGPSIMATPFFTGAVSNEAHAYWAGAATGFYRIGWEEWQKAAAASPLSGGGGGGGGFGAGLLGGAAAGAAGGGGGRGARLPWFMGGLSLIGIHNLMVTMGAQIIADTAGFIAFGVSATSTLSDVVTGMGTLETSYQTLDNVQKVAALSLNQFDQSLSHANETGVVTVLKEGLGILNSEMHTTGGVTQQATQAFMQFGGMLKVTLSSPAFKSAFGGLTSNVRTDMTALFGVINNLINLVPVLVKDFNGIGLAIVHGVGGAISLITKLGTAAGGVALKAGALGLTMYKSFGWLDSKIGFTSKLASLVGVSSLGVSAGTIGLGVGALAAEFYWLSKLPTQAQVMNNQLAQQIHLNQDSATSWYKLSAAMKTWSDQQAVQNKHAGMIPGPNGTWTPQGYKGAAIGTVLRANAPQGLAISAQDAQMARTVAANYAYLAQTYGMTTAQARQAMTAIGVKLTTALYGNSKAAQADRYIMQQYVATVQGAASPTSALAVDMMLLRQDAGNLAKQVQDLTAAFSQQLAPFANTVQMTVAWKQGNTALVAALKASHGQVGFNTAAQQASAQALATSVTNTLNLSQAVLQQTGSYKASMGPLMAELAALKGLHSNSTLVATAIHLIENAINALRSKSITISINVPMTGPGVAYLQGGFNAAKAPFGPGMLRAGLASGGMIRGGIPGKDSVVAALTPGEVVVPTHMVNAGAIDHLRGRLPGFDAGGMVYDHGRLGTGIAGGGGGGAYTGPGWGWGDTTLLEQILAELQQIRQGAPSATGAATAKALNKTAPPARQAGYYNSRSAHG